MWKPALPVVGGGRDGEAQDSHRPSSLPYGPDRGQLHLDWPRGDLLPVYSFSSPYPRQPNFIPRYIYLDLFGYHPASGCLTQEYLDIFLYKSSSTALSFQLNKHSSSAKLATTFSESHNSTLFFLTSSVLDLIRFSSLARTSSRAMNQSWDLPRRPTSRS